jgi:hypothetical protein
MAIFRRINDFLPRGTVLMVLVYASGKIEPQAREQLVTGLKTYPMNFGTYVPLYLDEDLKINFSVSSSGNLRRDLEPCKCSSPILPGQQFKSLNHAYQKISGLISLVEGLRVAPS